MVPFKPNLSRPGINEQHCGIEIDRAREACGMADGEEAHEWNAILEALEELEDAYRKQREGMLRRAKDPSARAAVVAAGRGRG